MEGDVERRFLPASLKASVWVFVSLAGVACGITVLFLAMRSVMKIGGVCAEGNTPFVPRHVCPKGVSGLLIGGIWGGLIFAGIYAWQAVSRGIPNLVGLLWPALFLSLGFNFLQFGISPPGGGGVAWAWLVCAALFIVMGGVPLLVVLPGLARGPSRPSTPSPGAARGGPWRRLLVPGRPTASMAAALQRTQAAAAPTVTGTGDVVSMLERLDALHRSGALNDQEYEQAKRRVLAPGTAT